MAELRSKKRITNTYAKVSRAMMERGFSRDTEQCHTKIKEFRQAYHKAREANGCSGSQPHTFRFYHELHAIMGGDATTTPSLSVDTCKGGVAWSGEEESLEDKEEDSVQAASGEFVFLPSQELFLTLDPIASRHSQGGLPDHDPGEGTSSANVSTWPLSTPSQRLVQIRWWKKRTQDDIFTKLMQSSRTDRAQLNVWRQTTAESRKALQEYEERRDTCHESRPAWPTSLSAISHRIMELVWLCTIVMSVCTQRDPKTPIPNCCSGA
ncbi:uncharacterized protein LOC127044371 isoform X2 [Gopherus flavomarginatus]|uniref:uncharacterized protein LOC127044371 isoform X2 n=1 Tax=Gopherus flavomarginatus TaxID=286002 RepID=UPI0021CC4294|nr:uncharacterized protein LOC127044371 isoform X2 [Gopherus flavomarginatus]